MIRKEGSKFVLRSKKGNRVLGRFTTRAQAQKRERQINFFKHKKK